MFKNKIYQRLFITGFVFMSFFAQAEIVGDENLIDPTVPLNNVSLGNANNALLGMLNQYEVSSILIRSNMRVAVINSKRVSVGEQVGNADVVSIDKNSVTLQVDGENKVIRLYENSVKTLSSSEE